MNILRVTSVAVVTITLCGAAGLAQERPSQPRPCATAEYRQFDFWLGSWEVFEQGGTAKVADVEVTSELDGCVVREQYRDSTGMLGQSLSSYDAIAGTWQQTWITNHQQLLVIHGHQADAALVFEGWIRDGKTESLVRASWAPDAGGVREIAERSVDAGKTWTPWFDLSFRLKAQPHR